MRPRTPKRIIGVVLAALMMCSPLTAQEKSFALNADPLLVETVLMQHLLPRFSMKTNTRVALVTEGSETAARLSTAATEIARPVITSGDTTWYLALPQGDPNAARFADWLASDVGQRTISSFVPTSHPPFAPHVEAALETRATAFKQDTSAGVSLSLIHCGRCHVIGPQNRYNSIGSTPSFPVLRGMSDWQARFETFYTLNPHPAFTQIEAVSAPFDPMRPSPIAPVEMTLHDLDEILAYVAAMAPADLGAPIRHQ